MVTLDHTCNQRGLSLMPSQRIGYKLDFMMNFLLAERDVQSLVVLSCGERHAVSDDSFILSFKTHKKKTRFPFF